MDFPDPHYGGDDVDYGPPPGAGMAGADYGAPPGVGFEEQYQAPPPGDTDYSQTYEEPQGYGEPQEIHSAAHQPLPTPTVQGAHHANGAPQTAAVDNSQFPADYVEAFQIYDKEYGDDAISAGMLGTVLRALGQNPTEGQLSELIQTMGKELFTVADVDAILRNYDLRDECSSEEIQDMWEMVAGPGQTFVQKSVLQAALAKIGDKIFEQDFAKIMMAANVGGDVVTFDQFERIMTN